MKFNNPINEQSIWAIIKSELGVDGKTGMELTRLITRSLKNSCEAALRMDRVELRKELEDELLEKYEEREAALKKREEVRADLTKGQVIEMIRESAQGGNAASQKILSDYIGLGKHEEDRTIEMVDFSDAPDWYRTKGPEE